MNKTIDYIAQLATPLALLGIEVMASMLKIVINPLIFTSIAYMLGFRDENLGVLFVLFSSPTAISSFVMAKAMDNDGDLVANIIIIATLGAVVTILIGVYILKSIGGF